MQYETEIVSKEDGVSLRNQ